LAEYAEPAGLSPDGTSGQVRADPLPPRWARHSARFRPPGPMGVRDEPGAVDPAPGLEKVRSIRGAVHDHIGSRQPQFVGGLSVMPATRRHRSVPAPVVMAVVAVMAAVVPMVAAMPVASPAVVDQRSRAGRHGRLLSDAGRGEAGHGGRGRDDVLHGVGGRAREQGAGCRNGDQAGGGA
jgi:hypothetical protein